MFEDVASRILLPALFDVSIKAAFAALSVPLLLALLPGKKDVALRHAAWCTVLLGMLTLPLWAALLPAVSIPILPGAAFAAAMPGAAVEQGSESLLAQGSGIASPAGQPARAERGRSIFSFSWVAGLAALYLAVSGWMLCRLGVGLAMGLRLARSARPVESSHWASYCRSLVPARFLRRSPTLWASAALRVPVTTGWLRPRILLPGGWEKWSEQKMEAVLSHEAAHVRRGDYLYQLLGALNCCLYWFHPLAWFLPRHLSALAEQACDADAVGRTRDRVRYASYLLEVAASLGSDKHRIAMPYLAMARSSQIGSRIDAVLEGKPARRLGKLALAAFYLFCAGLWLGASTLRLDAAQSAALAKAGVPPAAKGPVIAEGPFTDSSSLRRAWDRAADEAARQRIPGGFWIGYGIERPAGAVEIIGSDSQARANDSFVRREGARPAAPSRRVGFLFRLGAGGAVSADVTRIRIDDLSTRLDLGGEPLLWLGAWPADDSLDFLQELADGLTPALRKEIPLAVGLHSRGEDRAVEKLVETIRSDRSASVREEAIQGLGVMQSAHAVAALIDLARTSSSAVTRRETVFQLGNQPSKAAVEALADLVYEDPDLDVQKEALDALARSRTAGAREALTEVADRHPAPALRSEARELLQRGRPR